MIALRATQAPSAPVWQVCGESIGESARQSDEVFRGLHAAVKKNEPWTMARLPVADGGAIFGGDAVLCPGRGHQSTRPDLLVDSSPACRRLERRRVTIEPPSRSRRNSLR